MRVEPCSPAVIQERQEVLEVGSYIIVTSVITVHTKTLP